MNKEMYYYHATFACRIKGIKKKGLGCSKFKNWDDSKSGITYLCNDKDVAFDFCEGNDEVSDKVYDSGIVVLAIPKSAIDESKLSADENIILEEDEEVYSYEYTEIIAPSDIFVVTEDKDIVGRLTELEKVPLYDD